uniref:Uncharacterized protein n=1 Tax=Arundo donax TaxID=35708 RepID=A0A0A9C3L4_ARUDO
MELTKFMSVNIFSVFGLVMNVDVLFPIGLSFSSLQ